MAFKTSVERDQAIKALNADDDVEKGSVRISTPTQPQNYKSAPPTSFVNSVLRVLEANKVDSTVTDEIMRVFLDTLPESSFAQSFRRRLGTLGFERNAFDVFYKKSTSMVHQLASLEYSAKLYALRDEMNKHVNEKVKTEPARMLYDTLAGHVQTMATPNIAPWSRLATKLTFGATLGFNVSSALVQTAQVPMIVAPYLSGEYGYSNTMSAIGQATRLFFGSGITRKTKMAGTTETTQMRSGFSIDNYDYAALAAKKNPTAEEKSILQLRELATLADRYGLIGRTEIENLLDMHKGQSVLSKVNDWMGFMFHHSERMNREVSMVAAYQLELEKMRKGGKEPTGEDREAAAQKAIDLTELLNSGATANSAPLIAKSSLGKVAFMYKRYTVSMYYMLFKTTRDAMKAEDPMVRAAAKRQIAGIYATSALLAGAQGVPLYGAVSILYNLLFKGDDDDDFDTAARKYLGEGQFNGAVNYFTGTSIAGRIGLADMLIHNTGYREQDNAFLSFMQLVGGPAYGTMDRMLQGAKLISEGETGRGMEKVAPASISNVMKAIRFGTEGATTLRGDPVVGEIGFGHTLAQALGFTPAEYARQMEVNGALKNIDRRLNKERTQLAKQYFIALRLGDTSGAADALKGLMKLGERKPGFVTPEFIHDSVMQHIRTSGTMFHGITLSKPLRAGLLQNAAEYDSDVTAFQDQGE